MFSTQRINQKTLGKKDKLSASVAVKTGYLRHGITGEGFKVITQGQGCTGFSFLSPLLDTPSQTLRDHHPPDHLCQLCRTGHLPADARGRHQHRQLQPGKAQPFLLSCCLSARLPGPCGAGRSAWRGCETAIPVVGAPPAALRCGRALSDRRETLQSQKGEEVVEKALQSGRSEGLEPPLG